MEIKEKNGKYYMILSNGELEISESQAESLVKNRGAVIRNNLQNWIDNFYLKQWDVRKIPDTAEAYIRSDAFFDDVIRDIEQICIATGYKKETIEKILAFCNTQIERLNTGKAKSADAAFTDYQTLCWQRVTTFVQTLAAKYI